MTQPSPAPSAQTVLLTGASVGIGYELGKLFAADGYNLVLVARNAGKLEAVAGDLRTRGANQVHVSPADLSDPSAVDRLVADLAVRNQTIDVLVNNAGFGANGHLWEIDEKQLADMLQVNVVALTRLTRLLLPGMVARGRGRVMNLASTAAFQPGPLMAVYYASKAYVLSFSMALSDECRGTGVTVTAVCPGPTETEFHKRAGIADTPLFRANTMSAGAVAKAGYRALMRSKPVVVTGLKNKLLSEATRLVPRMLTARIAGKLNRSR